MTREETINYLNKFKDNQLSVNEAFNILTEYCLEFNKDPNETLSFLNFSNSMGMLTNLLTSAFNHYKRKHNVCEVLNVINNKQKQTLLYY